MCAYQSAGGADAGRRSVGSGERSGESELVILAGRLRGGKRSWQEGFHKQDSAYLRPGLGFAESQEGEFGLGRGALVLPPKSVNINIVRLLALDGY